MKRAIVWFSWGERFIDEAIDSARSAAAIEADRVLITDAEGAKYTKNNPAFTSIVQTRQYEETPAGKHEAVRFAFIDSTIVTK